MTHTTSDLSPVPSDRHRVLPMAGRTHGNRSPVTCHLRCGDACFMPAPNTTETTYFRDLAAKALSRRAILGTGAATGLRPGRQRDTRRGEHGVAPGRAAASGRHRLRFSGDRAGADRRVDDARRCLPGYRWHTIIRWGDPLFDGRSGLRRDQADRRRAGASSSATTATTSTSSRPTARAPRPCSWPTTSTPTRTSCSRRGRTRPR